MSTELATIDNEQLELIRRTVAKDATNDELNLFLYDCKRRKVHPLDRLLHFTKRQGKYTPITSIDLFRIRAGETGIHGGTDDATFEEDSKGNPIKATITTYKIVCGMRCPTTASARWAEYYPGDAQGFMWRKMPHTMLAKCAEALALRKAFPQELGGLYTQEEMDQAGIKVSDAEVVEQPKTKPAPAVSDSIIKAIEHELSEIHSVEDLVNCYKAKSTQIKSDVRFIEMLSARKLAILNETIEQLAVSLGVGGVEIGMVAETLGFSLDSMNAKQAEQLVAELQKQLVDHKRAATV